MAYAAVMSDSRLEDFISAHRRLFVLTGAGCSTGSGIPDYRDEQGAWKRTPPVTYQAFVGDGITRRRYWARSLVGWPRIAQAQPNAAHRALAALEAQGRCSQLLTQNVDGLHQAAGSRAVIDLHGRLDAVVCLGCGASSSRADVQRRLAEANPAWAGLAAGAAPDGDADLEDRDFATFQVPACDACGGVVGSSLMVYSGLRFVHAAVRAQIPVAAVNLGRTRADDLLRFRMAAPCGDALRFLLGADVPAPVMPPAAAAG